MRTERTSAALAALAALAASLVAWRLLPGRHTWSADEGDLVRLACAMAEDPRAWLRPDYHPSPEAFARLGDGLVAPPFASALFALSSLLGWSASSAWPLVSGALLLLGVAALARALRPGGRWVLYLSSTALVLALAPRFALDLLTLEAEIPLAAFSCFALALLLKRSPSTLHAAAAGALLGLAFLAKLWLVAPAALAALGALLAWRPGPRRIAAFLAAGLAVALLHLALVAALDPASLGRWLREVYLAPFLPAGGIASSKWAGVSSHPEWSHGFWYYPPAMARELGGALPLALLGAVSLVRGATPRPASWAALGLAAGVAALSVPAIKEPLYVLPAIAWGAALAVAALVGLARAGGGGRRWALAAGLLAVALAPFHAPPAARGGAIRSCEGQGRAVALVPD
jgi:hypothetical protein